MQQLPHITVATVIERDGKFLMVKEKSDGLIVYNQPAGHLEENETLLAAAERETVAIPNIYGSIVEFKATRPPAEPRRWAANKKCQIS